MPIDTDKPKREYMTIKIPKPKNIERIFYILIIIALLFFLFVYNPIPQITCKGYTGEDMTAAAITDDTSLETAPATTSSTTTETTSEPEATPEPEAEPEPEVTPVASTTTSTMATKSGEIGYFITKIKTEVKFPGKSNEFGKVLEVGYKIENNKETITNPKVKVYAYDQDSTTDEMNLERGEISLATLEKGETKTGTIKLKTGSFADITSDKTVKVKFYDGTKLLSTKTDIIKIK